MNFHREFPSGVREFRVTDFTENLHTLRDASNANDADKSTTELSAIQLQLEEREVDVELTRATIKKDTRWILLIIIQLLSNFSKDFEIVEENNSNKTRRRV